MTTPEPVAVGVDIGGTNIRVAAVAADGTIVARESGPNPVPADPVDPDASAERLVAEVVGAAARLGPGRPIGVGIAALVDRAGHVVSGPNIGVTDFPLAARLGEVAGVSVVVVNDASAGVWGEYRTGAGQGIDDVILLTVGTGVGGGVVIDGRLLEGRHGYATELGHVIVSAGGRLCPCGARGCLEAYASGRAIGEIATERAVAGSLRGPLAARTVIDGVAVTTTAAAGDAEAAGMLTEAGRWLGVAMATLVNVFDPGAVLIGGGAGAAAAPWLLQGIEEVFVPNVIERHQRPLPAVGTAALGDDAGVVGAALLAAHREEDARGS